MYRVHLAACSQLWLERVFSPPLLQCCNALLVILSHFLMTHDSTGCLQIKQDCSNYDEAQAWPLILDNYVEWRRKHS